MAIQYQRGQKIDVELDRIVPPGVALGRLPDGRAVFVKGGAPGELARVQLTRIKKDFAEATFLETVRPSVDRVTPSFAPAALAGANWHYLRYEAQVAAKEAIVKELLERIGGLKDLQLEPIVAANNQWRYRNKVELTFGEDSEGRAALGFHAPGRFDQVIPTDDIALFPQIGATIIHEIVDWANTHHLTIFNPRQKAGLLRNLVIRRAENGEDLLINLVTSPGTVPLESLNAIADKLEASMIWSENESQATIVRVDRFTVVAGTSTITEQFLGKSITYGFDSFFQVHTAMAEELAEVVLDRVFALNPEILIDGYAGVGGFGLFAADRGIRVQSIESHEASSRDAEHNAENLGVLDQMTFVREPMEHYLEETSLPAQAVLLVDPPRAGLHPKAVRAIMKALPSDLFYVSCGPATLARDIALLKEVYEPVYGRLFDMFPQTSHVETFVHLKRITK